VSNRDVGPGSENLNGYKLRTVKALNRRLLYYQYKRLGDRFERITERESPEEYTHTLHLEKEEEEKQS
jgi:hypothetical protein